MDIETEKQVMWDILKDTGPKSIKQQLEESTAAGVPTKDLYQTFVDISSKTVNKAAYKHLSYPDEIINDAVMFMIKNWQKADPNKQPFAYFYQLAVMSAMQHSRNEGVQHRIKEQLAESLALENEG